MARRNGSEPEPGTEVQTSPVEADVAEASAEAVTVAAEAEPGFDARQAALAALIGQEGSAAPEVITADTELVVDDSQVLDFGGRTKAVVIISYYNQFVDGIVRQAKKGQVIKTDADSLARGVRIKALRKLGD